MPSAFSLLLALLINVPPAYRGVTIPNLTVSIYMRAAATSDTFDTFMQHGRFFGYRTMDDDLVTVYMQRRRAYEAKYSERGLIAISENGLQPQYSKTPVQQKASVIPS